MRSTAGSADLEPVTEALVFADRLASRCADTLGDAVLSVILHGSLALGAFAPGRSDVDLLAIVELPLGDRRLAALRDAVEEVGNDAPCRVDLRIVTAATAGWPPRAPELEVAFRVRPKQATRVERRTAEPDLVPEFSIARAHGRTLVGRPPEAVIGHVPAERVLEVGDRQLAAWQGLTDDAAHAELMVLTACRIWRFAVERIQCSKTAAGLWVLERDRPLSVVEEALRQRSCASGTPIREEGIAHLLRRVRHELTATARIS